MIDQVRRDCRRWQLLPMGTTVVVGVSGGADSLALLHLLSGWQRSLKLTLHVATLDHGLRGAAGAADADFVEHYCRKILSNTTAAKTALIVLVPGWMCLHWPSRNILELKQLRVWHAINSSVKQRDRLAHHP